VVGASEGRSRCANPRHPVETRAHRCVIICIHTWLWPLTPNGKARCLRAFVCWAKSQPNNTPHLQPGARRGVTGRWASEFETTHGLQLKGDGGTPTHSPPHLPTPTPLDPKLVIPLPRAAHAVVL